MTDGTGTSDANARKLHGVQPIAAGPGSPLPLGARDCCDGVNFSVFSRHAESVELLLYDSPHATEPAIVFPLDPNVNKTGDVWHVLVTGIDFGQSYCWRAHGPWDPRRGHRFDGGVPLVDPYATALASHGRNGSGGRPQTGWRSLLVSSRFDWQGVPRPARAWSDTVIYELHVRGLTIDPSSGVQCPGGFLGVIEKIPYLAQLGITAVELMPVQEFDSTGGSPRNYWGYDPIVFRAPKESYGSGAAPGCQVAEFKTMVRELHRAGIEVIFDVVFNHTAEGSDRPTLCFRGLDNAIYYMLDQEGGYLDFTGCGNTVNCGHPVLRDHIIDCLRHLAADMHVDGFRFDLASVLGRDSTGRLLEDPPLLERIAQDPILRDVKLIAEAWDAGGSFQVGRFPGRRWAEWNSRFRDEVRRYWRGDPGTRGAFAARLCGSADIYERGGEAPVNSVNFVTCHDGFTLNDLVTYGRKHNEANGEANRDGPAEEFSANWGIEGPTEDPAVATVRSRLIRSMVATLLLSRGVPMILGGDEFRRTQHGNSNAWCQDNEVSWFDWRLAERNDDLVRFVRGLLDIRRRHPVLRADRFYSEADLTWFDRDGRPPAWDGPALTLGVSIHDADDPEVAGLCMLFNPTGTEAGFALPNARRGAWRVLIDTGRPPPDDLFEPSVAPLLEQPAQYDLKAHSMALLWTDHGSTRTGSTQGGNA